MNLKSILKKTLVLFILGILLIPIINVSAEDAVNIGNTSATIKGTGYTIDEGQKIIYLDSNASVELSGNANNYGIVVKENATNVSITLNDYTADTYAGGWKDTIGLLSGSSAKLILIGENHLKAGQEASAIRVPQNTSLEIDGNGTLYAEVDNVGSTSFSAVIGSQYNHPFGNITINGGNIHTSYKSSNGSGPSGIGSGWDPQKREMSGTITLNGGNIYTDVLGSATGNDEDKGKVFLKGNGNATVYTDRLDIDSNDFNGIVFDESGKTGTVMGNVVLNHDMNIPDGTVLTVEEGSSLTIPENVTVTNNGKIVNEGNITNNGTLQNKNGTIDNTDGNITSTTDIENVSGHDVEIILYNVTINISNGGTVNPNKSFEIEHGKSQTFDIVPNKGYKIKSVIVNGEDRIKDVINGKLTLENITKDMTIDIEFEKLPEVQKAIPINKDNIESPKTSI